MTVPISNMTQVFNNSANTFNAIGMNVVTGGQASDSTILNLKANGTLQFKVDIYGNTTIPLGSMYVTKGNVVIGDPSYWGVNA